MTLSLSLLSHSLTSLSWFPTASMMELRRHVRYAPDIRKLAMRIVHEAFGGKEFYALHIRLGDSKKRWDGKGLDGKYFVTKAERMKWSTKTIPLYIATEATSVKKYPSFYAPILKEWRQRVLFSKDLPIGELERFKNLFPKKSSFKMDMYVRGGKRWGLMREKRFGLVEQMICSLAKGFIG